MRTKYSFVAYLKDDFVMKSGGVVEKNQPIALTLRGYLALAKTSFGDRAFVSIPFEMYKSVEVMREEISEEEYRFWITTTQHGMCFDEEEMQTRLSLIKKGIPFNRHYHPKSKDAAY